ncbi:tRNA modification GTPase TrmE [Chthonomonas calidirosea]|uniref:tRNA modification GTPase MnmE n=1 Tax=Chthonomonas calidirosea (strain DSM 23976 / ICMP 18418 / T49) TaxID=1303518 RepID=S0ESI6_CHTCT|nr:tRNA uridine-5-carboxymethylaminomethyl(34) synthesis GTPase MnmE [Chthonomonas calidirosea]CCW34194.1 tRNA modification GTPase TrmE [Chthonomonas calidirosea T49]CEK15490.1 tRNA modification GTPase TrmE [Chthonomonas calidirosea]
MNREDTIVAVATAIGESAIAVVRLSGPTALPIAQKVFRGKRKEDITLLPGYTVRFGRFVDPQDETIDQGLLTLFRAPHSYTGEDMVELSCHGGRAIVSRILETLTQHGARLAEPGEFTQRAFLNGKLDLAQAEAVADLVKAKTERARRVALNQLEGRLSEVIHGLRSDIIGALAAVEVTIDYSDEVGELNYHELESRLAPICQQAICLANTARFGRILREGMRVALIGPPNAGKSSLLNQLLQTERAIVTPIPGTTRDLIEESLSINGIPIVLTDTAGLRVTADPVERIGVDLTLKTAEHADLLLFIVDASDLSSLDTLSPLPVMEHTGRPTLFILNKKDLITNQALEQAASQVRQRFPHCTDIISISALTGENIGLLRDKLLQLTTASADIEGVLITSARHSQAIQEAVHHLQEALATTRQRLPGDFIALDLREALHALGKITGETVDDEIIHRIFQDFCVGK